MAYSQGNFRADMPCFNVQEHHDDHAHDINPSSHVMPPTVMTEPSGTMPVKETHGKDRGMGEATLAPPGSYLDIPTSPGAASTSSASSTFTLEKQDDALSPDPGTEADFVVADNPFAFTPGHLNKLINPKSLSAFVALGGLSGLEKGLHTDINAGLNVDETSISRRISFDEARRSSKGAGKLHNDSPLTLHQPTTAAPSASKQRQFPDAFTDRIRVYNRNVLPEKRATPLWKLMWQAYNDKVLLILSAVAVVSLALGLYETLGVEHPPDEPMPVDWVEGLAICIAIIVVVLVGSINDFQKERAFAKLNAKRDDREVKVLRSGNSQLISVHDVLVGDVVHLEPGDLVPADGVFISGHNVKCDESSATGESDQLKKTGGDQVIRLLKQSHTEPHDLDPFIISGSKVLEGVGTYLVTSVGVNSSYGRTLMAMRQDMEATPLQVKLGRLATGIAKLGSTAAAVLFTILLIRFLADLPENDLPATKKASQFIDVVIVAVTVIVVAIPEGLPLAVTLALAFATTRLVKLNNLVRVLRSCETMGNATTVCSDKTGTLTTNRMTVVTGTFGNCSFDDKNPSSERHSTSFAQHIPAETRRLIAESVAINSTAFESASGNSDGGFVGSKTETALLSFARDVLGMGSLSQERSNAHVVHIMPFDSTRKCMGAVQRLSNGTYRFHVKGASEILLNYCSTVWMPSGNISMDKSQRDRLETIIDSYATQSLRTISLITKDFPTWPPKQAADGSETVDVDALLGDMTFLGVVGIQDPLRPGIPQAVAKCQHAGVTVRMVTGDNVNTAKAIAKDCGILTDSTFTDAVVMEGFEFRRLGDEQMKKILPNLRVLARSSPEDKRILVKKLREMDEVVAVTGDGTNDGPALKAADIGFSMGISGTEVAKEASAIILMDDNFASIVTALMWGRAVNDAVRKFLQFQLTVNITAVILTFVTSVADRERRSVLTAVQLLWINLIMDSLAALALATDPPTEEILNRKPAKRNAPLISTIMWKMIIGQTIFKLAVTLVLHFGGPRFLSYPDDQLRSVIFNAFVWMQIFNAFNNRRLDNKLNIFEGIHRNMFFVGIILFISGAQIAIAFVGGQSFSIVRINGVQWAISIITGALCLPWAVAIRCFPDEWFAATARFFGMPVLYLYNLIRRWLGGFGRVLRRKKEFTSAPTKDGNAETEIVHGTGSRDDGSTERDLEKGRSQ